MCSVKKEMSPRSVIILLLLSLFATFTFAKPGWHLIETEDGEGDADPGELYQEVYQENEPSDEDISNPDDRDGKDGNSQVPQPIPGPTQPTPGPTQPTPKSVEESDKDSDDNGMNMAQWPGTGGRGKINWGTGTGTGSWQGSWF